MLRKIVLIGLVLVLLGCVLVGTPYNIDFCGSITKGVVSSIGRNIGMWVDLIQTDAEGAPGSSGGPLLNTAFEIIGICVFGPNPGGGVVLCVPVTNIRLALEEYDAKN